MDLVFPILKIEHVNLQQPYMTDHFIHTMHIDVQAKGIVAAWAARKFYLRLRTVPLALRYIRCMPRALAALARYRRLGASDARGLQGV